MALSALLKNVIGMQAIGVMVALVIILHKLLFAIRIRFHAGGDGYVCEIKGAKVILDPFLNII